jgi:hypothetical protein
MTLQRKIYLLLFLLVLAGAAGLRACYWVGKTTEAVEQNPPLPPSEAARLQQANQELKKKAAAADRGRGVAVHRADSTQRRADKSQKQIDSLTTIYENVPAVVARATDDELFRQLASYKPSAFPDTSGR